MKKICIFLLLLSWAYSPVSAQTIRYDRVENTFTLTGVTPPIEAAGSKNKPYWKYFWEFGDGHYSSARAPRHCYDLPGGSRVRVRVSMTPYYSYQSPKVIEETFEVPRSNCRSNKSYEFDGLVNIETNAEGELVPGHEIQVVLHYKMPYTAVSSAGHLLFFYNSDQEKRDLKLDFYPLAYRRGRERLYDVTPLRSFELTEIAGFPSSTKDYVAGLLDDYQVKGFVCKLPPGEENRLFLTIAASNALDTTIIKGKKGELVTNLKAVWLPKGVPVSRDDMVDDYALRMLSVHDPNKIKIDKPNGPAYFHPGNPEEFQYTVQFQNKGGRPVRQVDISVPWDKNFDPNSLQVIKRDPENDHSCPDCPLGFNPVLDTISCFKKDVSRVAQEGKVYFTFYNVMIHGKREKGVGGGKYTKGFITYTVKSNKKMVDKTRSRATITFLGGETFETGTARKKWRHQGYGLKLGRNFLADTDSFEAVTDDFSQWFNVGFYYRNTASMRGLGWGIETSVAGLGLRAEQVLPEFTNSGLPFLRLNDEQIKITALDLQGQLEGRIGGIFGGGIGGGLSVPLTGEGIIKTNIVVERNLEENDLLEYWQMPERISGEVFDRIINIRTEALEVTQSNFGLLDNRDEVTFNREDISSSLGIGAIAHWYLEAGLLNNVAAGLRQDFRIYPNSYKKQCIKLNNFEVYLRLKLWSSK